MSLTTILSDFEQSPSTIDKNLEHAIQQLISFTPEIPHPGQGQTLKRWQILAQVAATNLNLVKWFESHLDAISILKELKFPDVKEGLWAVWAAEGGESPLQFEQGLCSGEKNWCSGAGLVDYGLMTYRNEHNRSQLLIVDMHQPHIQIEHEGWQAVGMQHTRTASIHFNQVGAEAVSHPNAYLDRPGFWHGAAGVAACWYGAAARLADFLYQECKNRADAYRLMYLGKISTLLFGTQQYFYHVAEQIDRYPAKSHERIIRILRAQVEQTAQLVLEQVGQALGARPFCENRIFASLAADLPVFLRQSHAAFDLEQIGQLVVQEDSAWRL
ncbi:MULTISPECIES: acyl-CoA dehydrogenase [unclassified Acinetobacter]|uniref:acyl-CoA dehydrogenase n=1 Tax=unclassified Acinetobacter TaxID=196816 RepID=UPI0025C3E00D|nr:MULTISPECIES: acyl-CoA dehydrogenase [unclassified Acinetobacter]